MTSFRAEQFSVRVGDDVLPLVPRLTDPAAHGIEGPAFDVVIPSLPGYGFSDRPARTGHAPEPVEQREERLIRFLEEEIWPLVPPDQLGKSVSKAEREEILGFDEYGA